MYLIISSRFAPFFVNFWKGNLFFLEKKDISKWFHFLPLSFLEKTFSTIVILRYATFLVRILLVFGIPSSYFIWKFSTWIFNVWQWDDIYNDAAECKYSTTDFTLLRVLIRLESRPYWLFQQNSVLKLCGLNFRFSVPLSTILTIK